MSPAVFLIKAVRPRKIKPEVFVEMLGEELVNQGEIIKREYEKTVRTWRHKPEFDIEAKVGMGRVYMGQGAQVSVGTDDEIYAYVDKGTRVRRAVMSRGFRPKTRTRVIGSTAGRGGMVFVSRRISRPGIKAREFSDEIRKRRRRPFYNAMKKAMQKAVRHARD